MTPDLYHYTCHHGRGALGDTATLRTPRDLYGAVFARLAEAWAPRYLPTGWEPTVAAFLDAGLDVELIIEMARVALGTRGIDSRWAYFCGCCWKRVRQLQDRALAIVTDAVDDVPTQAPNSQGGPR